MPIGLTRLIVSSFVSPLLLLFAGCSTNAQVQKVSAKGSDFALTVYSTADPATFNPQDLMLEQLSNRDPALLTPGYGVVREVRHMNLKAGDNRVEFSDVATGIDPTTVAFQSITAPSTTDVLEQNFEYDLTNPDKLLQKYLGRDVVISTKPPYGPGEPASPIRGRLLSFEPSSYTSVPPAYVIQTDPGRANSPVMIVRGDNIRSVSLAGAGQGLVSKPTLNWIVRAQQPGAHDVAVRYQTDGLTWRADYSLLLNDNDAVGDLSAWVTLVNGSGITYPNAAVKLVAGNVQRFERAHSNNNGGGASLFGGVSRRVEGFNEEAFFEYHLYTLGRRTTLPNTQPNRSSSFRRRAASPSPKRSDTTATSRTTAGA